MKTKAQKKVEFDKGKKLLGESRSLVFSDITSVPTKDVNRLRRELKKIGGNLLVIKKRILSLVFKEKGIDMEMKQFKMPTATIFSKPDVEEVSNPVFKFFSSLEVPEGKEKDLWTKHILGAYDLKEKVFLDSKKVMALGKLPSREVALGQVLGMIAAPIRSFLYILKQKSMQSAAASPASTSESEAGSQAGESSPAKIEVAAPVIANEPAAPQPETK